MTAESVARAAKMREESRGAHTRVDFEGERDEWLQYNIVISKSNEGTMIVDKVMRDEPDPELKRIARLSIEELENEVLLEATLQGEIENPQILVAGKIFSDQEEQPPQDIMQLLKKGLNSFIEKISYH